MNQTQSYMEMHPASHISSGPSYSHSAPAPLAHYQQYPQPPVLPPSSNHYGAPQSYNSYGYANGVTSPQSATGPVAQQVQSQIPSLPGMSGDHEDRTSTDIVNSYDDRAEYSALIRASDSDFARTYARVPCSAAI